MKLLVIILCVMPMLVSAAGSLELSAQNFLAEFVVKWPWLSILISVITSSRFILKPIFSLAHATASLTISKRDDKIISKIENSKILKILLFISDWLFSAKLLNPQKLAEYRRKKLK